MPLTVLDPDTCDWDTYVDQVLRITPDSVSDGEWLLFLDPARIVKTRRALLELLADLEETFKEKRLTLPTYRYTNWRNIEGDRQRAWIHKRLALVKQAANEIHRKTMEKSHNRSRAVAVQLALAVQRHRLATLRAGYEPELHDRDLWAALSKLTLPYEGEPRTLDELLGAGIWFDGDDQGAEVGS